MTATFTLYGISYTATDRGAARYPLVTDDRGRETCSAAVVVAAMRALDAAGGTKVRP